MDKNITLHRRPTPIISFKVTCPFANTNALGGVPIGKRSAIEIHRVTGAKMSIGLRWYTGATHAKAGSIIFATATLDIILVVQQPMRLATAMTAFRLYDPSLAIKVVSQSDRPES